MSCVMLLDLRILSYFDLNVSYTDTLTPMHLRKAKLMFFYVRYPSSAILKVYFPDVQFNKNNTAQLVKWFSNFRWAYLFFHATLLYATILCLCFFTLSFLLKIKIITKTKCAWGQTTCIQCTCWNNRIFIQSHS